MHVESINLEIQPVEREGLYQTQHSFAEESIDSKWHLTLIKQRDNRVTKHKADKGIRPLDLMFDVRAGREIESLLRPRTQSLTYEHSALEHDKEGVAENVQK
jgi:hypothetical protein